MKNDVVPIEVVDESEVPEIIQSQFHELGKLQKSVKEALKKAESAKKSASTAKSKSADLFQKKEAIESLQDATADLADAQVSAADAQKISFEYQEKLGRITQYLFGLGVANIAVNRTVVREIEMRLKGASKGELSDLAKQEMISVVKQLKAQEDILKKQESLSENVKNNHMSIVEQMKKDRIQDRAIQEQAAKDQEHDRLITEQARKDQEHDRLIAEQDEKDQAHDRFIEVQNNKNKELDQKLAAQSEQIKQLTKELESLKGTVGTKTNKNAWAASALVAAAGFILALVQYFI